MAASDRFDLHVTFGGAGLAALSGLPWYAVVIVVAGAVAVAVVCRYLRHRERLEELRIAGEAAARVSARDLPGLLANDVYHASRRGSDRSGSAPG